jgi:hypothetical protein
MGAIAALVVMFIAGIIRHPASWQHYAENIGRYRDSGSRDWHRCALPVGRLAPANKVAHQRRGDFPRRPPGKRRRRPVLRIVPALTSIGRSLALWRLLRLLLCWGWPTTERATDVPVGRVGFLWMYGLGDRLPCFPQGVRLAAAARRQDAQVGAGVAAPLAADHHHERLHPAGRRRPRRRRRLGRHPAHRGQQLDNTTPGDDRKPDPCRPSANRITKPNRRAPTVDRKRQGRFLIRGSQVRVLPGALHQSRFSGGIRAPDTVGGRRSRRASRGGPPQRGHGHGQLKATAGSS